MHTTYYAKSAEWAILRLRRFTIFDFDYTTFILDNFINEIKYH